MTWQKINDYYAKQGDYTMTHTSQPVPKPIGLYRNNVAIGYYATSKEANDMFNQLTGETK